MRGGTLHRQVEILTAPFREAAHRHLRRFHRQEAQQRVALFRDMSQPSPIPARLLQWHQSQIARDLLATRKPTSRFLEWNMHDWSAR